MSPVYLYILMRTDLASLNPGKAVAQGTHAANQCIFELRNKDSEHLETMLHTWESETKAGFGTCVVLGVKEAEMRRVIAMAQEMGLHANITHDPSYPLVDGEVVHLIPLDTCGYVFAHKDDAKILLSDLSLMP